MFENTLVEVVKNIGSNFEKDELAYLAMTSKAENPLRDKIAFALHQKLKDQHLICREWKRVEVGNNRTDLAIVNSDTQKPAYLIEFKAHSLQRFEKEFADYFHNELTKMMQVADDDTELYYIFFQNLPHGPVKDVYHQAVKYVQPLNYFFEKHKLDIHSTREKIHKDWDKEFIDANNHSKNKLRKFSIDAGCYYDVPLTIEVFFYGPIKMKA